MRLKGLTAAFAALALGSVAAHASTFVALTADQLITESDSIVQGRVIGVESRWDDAGRIVISEARILVSESLVGKAPSIVTVTTPGGEVGDLKVEAAGFPQFTKGQEVILFLKGAGEQQRIVGHQQGHIEVVTRLDGVTLAVPQLEDGVNLLTPSGQVVPAPQSIELKAFKANLKARAARLGKSAK